MKYLSLFLCLLSCISCHTEHSAPEGDCPYPITLSEDELLFSPEGGSSNVVANRTSWQLSSSYLHGIDEECEYTRRTSDYCKYNYCEENSSAIMKIECSWFSVTRIDGHTLLVLVDKNEIGSAEREQFIGLWAGNCGPGFRIKQSSEDPIHTQVGGMQ